MPAPSPKGDSAPCGGYDCASTTAEVWPIEGHTPHVESSVIPGGQAKAVVMPIEGGHDGPRLRR